MSRRKLRIGDVVVICPEAVADLEREGYRDVKAHVPATIVDDWASSVIRRVFELDMVLEHKTADRMHVSVWASQVRLAAGRTERARIAAEKRVAEMVAAKAEREAKRRIPKSRRTT